jgi:hypothetical protein
MALAMQQINPAAISHLNGDEWLSSDARHRPVFIVFFYLLK